MRVLGVDPGTVATGWGVVDEIHRRLTYVAGGVIRARGPIAQRLARIYEQAQRILTDFQPTCVSLEKTFVGDNVQSAFRLGEARGAILVAAAQAGVPVTEYSPAEIKVAIAGNGRAAKEQMQIMVARLLTLSGPLAGDEADALGAAICHVHTHSFIVKVTAELPARSRGRRRLRSAWERRAQAGGRGNITTPHPDPLPGGEGTRARRGRIPRLAASSPASPRDTGRGRGSA